MKLKKTPAEMLKLDKQIRHIFKDFDLTLLKIDKRFVEFNYQNIKNPRAGNEIDFSILQALHKLLKPKNMLINGWTNNTGCEQCNVEENYGYVVAYFE